MSVGGGNAIGVELWLVRPTQTLYTSPYHKHVIRNYMYMLSMSSISLDVKARPSLLADHFLYSAIVYDRLCADASDMLVSKKCS